MEPYASGKGPGRSGPARPEAAKPGPHAGRRAPRGQRTLKLNDARRAVALMDSISHTEEDIAETLRNMAKDSPNEAAVRRLKLAGDAMTAAENAVKYREQLHEIADRWVRHIAVTEVLQSLYQAGRQLAGLASAEYDVAASLTGLAGRSEPGQAVHLRNLAEEALTEAEHDNDRAELLDRLATSIAAGTHRPSSRA